MLENVNWEKAFTKSLAGTITGVVMGVIKPHVLPPVAKMLGQNGNFAGPIMGFVFGFLLEALAPELLKDYSDIIYGSIMGALASDPIFLNNSAPAPAQPAPVVYVNPAPAYNPPTFGFLS